MLIVCSLILFQNPRLTLDLPIKDMVRGPNGLLWPATHDGLRIWDGHRLSAPNIAGESAGFALNQSLTNLCFAGDFLWIASDEGLVRLDPVAQNARVVPQTQALRITALCPAGERLLFATAGKLYSLSMDTLEIEAMNGFNGTVSGLYFDRDQVIWAATGKGLYTKPLRGESSPHPGLEDQAVHDLLKDSSGLLWAAAEKGLVLIERSGDPPLGILVKEALAELPQQPLYAIAEDDHGRIWVAGEQGFYLMDFRLGRTKKLQSRLDSSTKGMTPDGAGGMWVFGSKGLFHIHPLESHFLSLGDDSLSPAPQRLAAGVDHTIWALSERGLYYFDEVTGTRRGPYERPPYEIHDMLPGKEENLWLATDNGLWKWDSKNETGRQVGLTGSRLTRICRGEGQTLWAAGPSGVVSVNEETPDSTPRVLEWPYSRVRDMVWNGGLWLACSLGLFRSGVDPPYQLTRISSEPARTLHLDDEGILWAGTASGLLGFRRGSSDPDYTIGLRRGLPPGQVRAVQRSQEGSLWLLINRQIVRYHPESGRISARSFPAGAQPAPGAFLMTAGDKLVLGAPGGFYRSEAEELLPFVEITPLLTAFSLNDEPGFFIPNGKAVQLETDYDPRRRIQLQLAAPQGPPGFAMRYLYKVGPGAWQPAHAASISLAGLSPGRHSIQARVVGNSGEPATLMTLRVKPALWRTPWVVGLSVLVAAGIFWRLVYSRQKKHKLAVFGNLVRSEPLVLISHELRTPLNGIIGMAEAMLAANHTHNEHHDYPRLILQWAKSLEALVDDLVDYARLRTVDQPLTLQTWRITLHALVADLIQGYPKSSDDRSPKDRIVNEVPVELDVLADERRLRQVLLNLIENANRFAPEGPIHISASESNHMVRVAVRDQGDGIPRAQRELVFEAFHQEDAGTARSFEGLGLGLYICRELVRHMGGEIWIEDSETKGCQVVFQLPAAHPTKTGL